MTHKTKTIKIGRKKIKVDEKLTDVIYHLNKVGLKTLSCCQKDIEGDSYILLDYSKIRLVSVINTPYPVLLIKWRKINKKPVASDRKLSTISDAINKTNMNKGKCSA